jgi:hypothetical protein
MSQAPYLSIVAVGRNDNYGKDFTKRLELFLRSLKRFSARYPGLFELVFVEWNPPDDKPRLKDAFDWSGIRTRIITVPHEVHAAIPHSNRTPFFESFAKNVGIRRARTPFVLMTNPDVLFSDELCAFLARRQLDEKCYYRVDRHDFKTEDMYDAAPEEITSRAAQNIFVVHTRWVRGDSASFETEGKPMEEWAFSEALDGDDIREKGVCFSYSRATPHLGLHLNAGGDFLLMAKKGWEAVHGYCERPDYTAHLDGLLITHARAVGLQQVMLTRPYYIMHMDHERREPVNRPQIPYKVVHQEIMEACEGRPLRLSGSHWGCGGAVFEEWRSEYEAVLQKAS